MDFLKESGGLLCMTKALVSSLNEMILGKSSSYYASLQSSKEQHYFWPKHPGLKILIYSPSQNSPHPCFILHSFMIPSSSPSNTSSTAASLYQQLTDREFSATCLYSSSSSELDDLIGAESGVCMKAEEAIGMQPTETCNVNVNHVNQENKNRRSSEGVLKKKQYPPPIPLLARTGNLPGHMPWVLARHYVDGKLILVEERVKHHDYFEARRENGTLTLKLISLDNTLRSGHNSTCYDELEEGEDLELEEEEAAGIQASTDSEQEEEEEVVDEANDDEEWEDTDVVAKYEKKTMTTLIPSSLPRSYMKNSQERSGGDLRKCFSYAGKMISDAKTSLYNNGNGGGGGHGISARGYMAEPGSAPMTFNVCPVAIIGSVA
ncbi:hypothetical protein Tsubulata_008561 [Turnera subulata]|uniref:FAF domain-containing protein n=1 Tax=Turnera subulata TaxID=218843 RepID=A0A9Q0JG64_9ROSI|nr:hypothetical protein Tsubulata_008561 [Turnera subulata]